MKSLTWSLDKAPAFSNAKFLIISLPPCLHQQASVFHQNAYPPVYGTIGAIQPNSLPDYHDQGYRVQTDDKESWYAPPQALGEQKVHAGNEDNIARDPDDQLHRINSARHSLPPARRDSLNTTSDRTDGVSRAYGVDTSDNTALQSGGPAEAASFYAYNSDVQDGERGLTRPRRSSSRSSRSSGRIL